VTVNSSANINHLSRLEQQFHLEDDDGFQTVKLKVLSMASAPSFPSYLEGQAVEGEVIVNSKKPESIKSVSIAVSGEVTLHFVCYAHWQLNIVVS